MFEGLRVGKPSAWNQEQTDFVELGRVKGTSIGLREAGSATWNEQPLEKVAALGIEPEHLDPIWPEDDEARGDVAIGARVDQALRYGGSWPGLGWTWASDPWLERAWARVGDRVVRKLVEASSWYADQQEVPVVVRGVLKVARGAALGSPEVTVLRRRSRGGGTSSSWRQRRG